MKFPSLLFALLCLSTPIMAQQNVVTAPIENVAATVTIRTEGGLQVSETRRATLNSGANRVELAGLSSNIVGNSLQSEFVGPGKVEVIEQSQRLYSGSPDLRAVLRRYVGKTVTFLRYASEKAIAGTLLQADGAILLETAEGVLVDPVGTYIVPRDTHPLSTPDAVVLGVEASAGGDYRIESNYLVAGGSWSANYRATLSAPGDRLELHGFAALQLPSNLYYETAQIVLQPQKGDGTLQPLVTRPVDISRGNRQIAFYNATIAVAQRNVYRAAGEFTANSEGAPRLVLKSVAPIGVALPSGPLTLYRERAAGPPDALTVAIPATPPDAVLQISLGDLPGVKVARRIVKTRQLSPVTTEYTVEITLTNASKLAQPVEIIEDLPVNPTLGEANPQPVFDEAARTLTYLVTVAPEGSLVLKYVVESKTG